MRWLLSVLAILFLAAPVYGQAKYQNWCQQGGQRVQTQGQQSTTFVQRSFPACTITVFNAGTTQLAQIFSNVNQTPLGNPFMNQSNQTGQFFFYAANGHYDIQIAATGLTTFTLTDVILNDATGGGGPGPPPAPSCTLTALPANQIATCISASGNTAYPQWFGAKADGSILGGEAGGTGCNGTAGSAMITCVNARFNASDVGKRADLAHAGTPNCGTTTSGRNDLRMNCNLVTTIASVQGSSAITLATNVLSTVTNEQFAYASSDDAAIQAALDSGANTVALIGIFGITGTGNTYGNGFVGGTFYDRSVVGSGPGGSKLLKIGPVAWDGGSGGTFLVGNGTRNFTMRGVSMQGTNELGEVTTFGPTHDGLVVCSGIPNNPAICAGLPGNENGGIGDIRFIDCDFSNFWGIGWHAPGTTGPNAIGGIYNVTISHSNASFNSYDGINPGVTDGLIITSVNASYNGTGGLEVTSYGSLTVTGSVFNHNRNAGATVGGFNDATSIGPRTCQISGNDFSENGNGWTTAAPAGSGITIGVGLTIGQSPQNCAITGNTMRHNHQIGLEANMFVKDQNHNISANIFSTNGLVNASSASFGIFAVNSFGLTVANNTMVNEPYNAIVSIGRTANVVTVTTSTSHNYLVGYSVFLKGTPNGAFDSPSSCDAISAPSCPVITTVADGATFTFAQTGPDVATQTMMAGGSPLGATVSLTGGFDQWIGLGVNTCRDSQFLHNHIRNHDYANAVFQEFLPGSPYLHCLFVSDANTYGQTGTPTGNGNDLYMLSQTGGTLAPLLPSSNGLTVSAPSQQLTTTACTTAAAPGATCTVTINHGFTSTLSYASQTAQALTAIATACRLDNAPTAQTGNPVVLKVTQLNYYQATVTIGSFDGQAAGGGSLTCTSNFRY